MHHPMLKQLAHASTSLISQPGAAALSTGWSKAGVPAFSFKWLTVGAPAFSSGCPRAENRGKGIMDFILIRTIITFPQFSMVCLQLSRTFLTIIP